MQFQKYLNTSANINSGFSSEDSYKTFFSQLPRTFIIRLYDYYKLDFDMFGYKYPAEYIQMGYSEAEDEKEVEESLGKLSVRSS